MSWNLFFMIVGVAYAATWIFKIVDLIEAGDPRRESVGKENRRKSE